MNQPRIQLCLKLRKHASICFMVLLLLENERLKAQPTAPPLNLVVYLEWPQALDEAPEVICRLTNVSDKPVWRTLTTAANGFGFELYDATGELIPQESKWAKLYAPEPRGEIFRANYKALKPGQTNEFRVRLDEPYQDRWKLGKKLDVKWYPGSGPRGERIVIDGNLSATLDLKPSDASKPSSTKQVPTETHIKIRENSSSPTLQDGSSNQAPTSLVRWRWPAVAIILIVIVAALVAKRVSQSS